MLGSSPRIMTGLDPRELMGGSGGVRLLRNVDWNEGIAPLPGPPLLDRMLAISKAFGELVTLTDEGDLAEVYGGGELILFVPGYGGGGAGGPGITRGTPGGGWCGRVTIPTVFC